MKTYWDSSALVKAFEDEALEERLKEGNGMTRLHSIAEFFSTLTGGKLGYKLPQEEAAEMAETVVKHLEMVTFGEKDMIDCCKRAKKAGVRGARIHDFLHVAAAEKAGAKKILTLDRRDFAGLTGIELEII